MIDNPCPKCAAKVLHNFNFCPQCGNKLGAKYALIYSPQQINLLEVWFKKTNSIFLMIASLLTFGLYYDASFLDLIKKLKINFQLNIKIFMIVISVLASSMCMILGFVGLFLQKFGFVEMSSSLMLIILWILIGKAIICGAQSIYIGGLLEKRLSFILKKEIKFSIFWLGIFQLFYILFKLERIKNKNYLIINL